MDREIYPHSIFTAKGVKKNKKTVPMPFGYGVDANAPK